MFDTGNILYCQDFQFNNGNTPKSKYFIVLKRDGNKVIVGSLPTRTNKIPSFIEVEHGCVNKDERRFNCYLFKAGKPICDNGFCFDLPTFVYGEEIDIYEADIIDANYRLNENYTLEGKLTKGEFVALITCFLNSDTVRSKIKRNLPKVN